MSSSGNARVDPDVNNNKSIKMSLDICIRQWKRSKLEVGIV